MTTETTAKQFNPDYHGYLSMDEIISYGLPYKKLPQTKQCEFCGKLVEPTGVIYSGEVTQ